MADTEAILFDLDGTLLDLNYDRFMDEYLKSLAGYFPEVAADRFAPALLESTGVMLRHDDPERTVMQAFLDDFFPRVRLSPELASRFWAFYDEAFPALRHWGKPMPGARDVVETVLDRGLKVALATAPIFPETAIRSRLQWAGLEDLPFDLITASETMHTSKPSRSYYEEAAKLLGVPTEACLMIGDEAFADGPATQAGMSVILFGPDHGTNMEGWFPDAAPGRVLEALPRLQTHAALLEALQARGIV